MKLAISSAATVREYFTGSTPALKSSIACSQFWCNVSLVIGRRTSFCVTSATDLLQRELILFKDEVEIIEVAIPRPLASSPNLLGTNLLDVHHRQGNRDVPDIVVGQLLRGQDDVLQVVNLDLDGARLIQDAGVAQSLNFDGRA